MDYAGAQVSKAMERDRHGSEVCLEIPIAAVPATVFALLTNSKLMSCWLAQDVLATPQAGGVFRLWDPKGCWVEGAYLAAIPNQLVAFTWGGIEGLRLGQSVVTFILEFERHATIVRLRHSQLPSSAVNMHRLGWMQFGLPRLKAVAEGYPATGTYLGDIAEHREDTPYLSRFHCPDWESYSSGAETCLGSRSPLAKLLN
jgi:uncharacterized protein YndB with AHSA1/START domain